MSHRGARPAGLNGLLRQHSRRHLRRELAALRAVGLPTVVFEPGPAEQAAMGDELLCRDHVDEVVQAAFLAAAAHAAEPAVQLLLAPRVTN
jgi:NTE family protein